MENPADTEGAYGYRLYDLAVKSSIRLPGLTAWDGDSPDIFIRLGPTPRSLARCRQRGVCYEAQSGEFLIWVDGVARFHVANGLELVVEAELTAEEGFLRSLIFSSPFAALFLQRGLLPMHASAISTPRGAVLFCAGTGLGKSTLAGEFRRRGFRVLADDIGVVRFEGDGSAWIMPGYPELRLWPDALVQLGENPAKLPRMRRELEKRILSCPESFETKPVRLYAVYMIPSRPAKEKSLTVMPGGERVAAMMEHTYRSAFVAGLGVQETHFSQILRLARGTRVAWLARPEELCGIQTLADLVQRDWD